MKNNFIYWLAGNIVSIGIGIYILICYILLVKSNIVSFCYIFSSSLFGNIIFFVAPFLGGFILKIIKKDISFLYYSTVGISYQILFQLCTHGNNNSPDSLTSDLFYKFIFLTIITSTIGGITALLLNNFFAHRKKIFNFIR